MTDTIPEEYTTLPQAALPPIPASEVPENLIKDNPMMICRDHRRILIFCAVCLEELKLIKIENK